MALVYFRCLKYILFLGDGYSPLDVHPTLRSVCSYFYHPDIYNRSTNQSSHLPGPPNHNAWMNQHPLTEVGAHLGQNAIIGPINRPTSIPSIKKETHADEFWIQNVCKWRRKGRKSVKLHRKTTTRCTRIKEKKISQKRH